MVILSEAKDPQCPDREPSTWNVKILRFAQDDTLPRDRDPLADI